MTTEEYILENNKRLAAIGAVYNPITGEGSLIKREPLKLEGFTLPIMYLPKEMFQESLLKELKKHKLRGYLKKHGIAYTKENISKLTLDFYVLRIKYDFEFFAYMCCEISGKGMGMDIPFKLNRAQRKYLSYLEDLRIQQKPINVILLKARQWGGSTLTQIYMLWIQLLHRRNWNSVICGDVENQANIVTGMITKVLRKFPLWASKYQEIKSRPYEHASKTRIIDFSNCIYSIGSAQKPENLRCQDISMAHLTEVGVWKETLGKKPEDLIQSIFGSIYSAPYTVKVLESTAKGVGNYFHRTWNDAQRGENSFTPVFVAWFEIDIYSKPIDGDIKEFINSLNSYEQLLFSLGATLEAICWYREILCKDITEEWRRKSEFPSFPEEAFQSTGHPFYPLEDVNRLLSYVRDPSETGELVALSDHGIEAINDLEFHKATNGSLKIWEFPELTPMEDRYVVVMDVSKGISLNADNGVICVFDRYWMKDPGGVPEVVAEWCGHIPMRNLIWKGVQLAKFYCDAFLVIESNTPETSGQSGFEMESVFDEIAEHYDNMYCRTPAEQIIKGVPRKWGFHTNRSTKTMVCTFQQIVLAKDMYIEPCREAIEEHYTFEVKPNGSLGAVEGNHDDRHITRAIGNWVCYQHLPPPILRDETKIIHRKHNYFNESSL